MIYGYNESTLRSKGVPPEDEIIDYLKQYSTGVDAGQLNYAFIQRGYHPTNTQIVIRRCLDSGSIHIGSKLWLFAS